MKQHLTRSKGGFFVACEPGSVPARPIAAPDSRLGYAIRAAETSTWCYGNELHDATSAITYGRNATKGNIE